MTLEEIRKNTLCVLSVYFGENEIFGTGRRIYKKQITHLTTNQYRNVCG